MTIVVFKTQSETESYHEDLQAHIEQPELHMLAVCSSVENQVALIEDRNMCTQDLHSPVHDSSGTEIKDELVFFYGDKR